MATIFRFTSNWIIVEKSWKYVKISWKKVKSQKTMKKLKKSWKVVKKKPKIYEKSRKTIIKSRKNVKKSWVDKLKNLAIAIQLSPSNELFTLFWFYDHSQHSLIFINNTNNFHYENWATIFWWVKEHNYCYAAVTK